MATKDKYKKDLKIWEGNQRRHIKSLQLALKDSKDQIKYHQKNIKLLEEGISVAKQSLKNK